MVIHNDEAMHHTVQSGGMGAQIAFAGTEREGGGAVYKRIL
jgi:hypothetical protein